MLTRLLIFCLSLALAGCQGFSVLATSKKEDMPVPKGPPIRDIVTPYDKALTCLRTRVNPKVTFAVGAIIDQTGKEQFTDGGVGKFVTQGAGDMVQSALFSAGVSVLNRRDPRVIEAEMKWALQDQKSLISTDYFVTGSINSLDILPGGGIQAEVNGIGPTYSQMRLLVGIDLSLTSAKTSQVVANVPLQKQIFASDFNFAMGNFIGNNLFNVSTGCKERETILRQMLNLATFELLAQIMAPKSYADCMEHIDRVNDGYVANTKTTKLAEEYRKTLAPKSIDNESPDAPKNLDPVKPPTLKRERILPPPAPSSNMASDKSIFENQDGTLIDPEHKSLIIKSK
mgnify:CR=1 FL=1